MAVGIRRWLEQLGRELMGRRQDSRMTAVRLRPSLDFSVTGLLYCSIMLFMGLAALNSQANLLFGIFGLMIGTLLVSGVISRWVIRKLYMRRVFPEHGVVGEKLRVVYEMTNKKRFWPSLSVCLAELDGAEAFTLQPQCYMLHAAAGMTTSVQAELIPKRRGLHELDRYQLGTGFPFGFVKRARIRGRKDYLLIYPALGAVDDRLISMCRSAEITGSTVRPQAGGADEFYGVKQFREGENRRLIYWRRSARTGVLVSKEMTKVAPPRLLMLVDTFLEHPGDGESALVEQAIAMAGSLARTALEQGLSVGLFTWSGGWLALPPVRGKQQRSDLLSALARLPLNREHPLSELLEQCHTLLLPGVTPVLLTPRAVQLGLNDEVRGGMLIVSSSMASSRGWFHFDPSVDFTSCMPADQQYLPSPLSGKRNEAAPAPAAMRSAGVRASRRAATDSAAEPVPAVPSQP